MLAEDKNLDLTRNRHMAALWNRVSIQGVKSIWGITSFFQDWAPGTLTVSVVIKNSYELSSQNKNGYYF